MVSIPAGPVEVDCSKRTWWCTGPEPMHLLDHHRRAQPRHRQSPLSPVPREGQPASRKERLCRWFHPARNAGRVSIIFHHDILLVQLDKSFRFGQWSGWHWVDKAVDGDAPCLPAANGVVLANLRPYTRPAYKVPARRSDKSDCRLPRRLPRPSCTWEPPAAAPLDALSNGQEPRLQGRVMVCFVHYWGLNRPVSSKTDNGGGAPKERGGLF